LELLTGSPGAASQWFGRNHRGDCRWQARKAMLYLVGLGLADETDITIKGLDVVRKASRVYLEAYTSILLVEREKLVRLSHPSRCSRLTDAAPVGIFLWTSCHCRRSRNGRVIQRRNLKRCCRIQHCIPCSWRSLRVRLYPPYLGLKHPVNLFRVLQPTQISSFVLVSSTFPPAPSQTLRFCPR
jgi:hypothetical protein